MTSINATNARQSFFKILEDVNLGFNPVTIVNSRGKNAVILSENDWKDIEETLVLMSVPGYLDSIKKAQKEDYNKNKKYIKGEEW